jgi:5'-nucleotidase
MKRRILICNDDGIYSPGIAALAKVASLFGEVRIVAPDVEQSSMGAAITSSRPVRYRRTSLPGGFEAYRVNGTPSDCVALGVYQWSHVDLVLSGINLGPNLGSACWHSGTLAAAKQAALFGLRGIAFSTAVNLQEKDPDFASLEPFVERVLKQLLEEKSVCLVNVNLPEKPKGIRWTHQAMKQYDGEIVSGKDPLKRPVYWFTVKPLRGEEEGTDRWAFARHFVSITPLRLDLTDEKELARVLAMPHHTTSLNPRLGPDRLAPKARKKSEAKKSNGR